MNSYVDYGQCYQERNYDTAYESPSTETDTMSEFLKAVDDVNNLQYKPSNEQLLELYGLYKQVYEGDCTHPEPKGLFSAKDKRKWNAWYSRRGLPQLDAMQQYIQCRSKLIR